MPLAKAFIGGSEYACQVRKLTYKAMSYILELWETGKILPQGIFKNW